MNNTKKAPESRVNGHSLALVDWLRKKREVIAIALMVSGAISLICSMLCLLACGAHEQGYAWAHTLLYLLGAGCQPDDVWALYLLVGLGGVVYANQLLVHHDLGQQQRRRERRKRP